MAVYNTLFKMSYSFEKYMHKWVIHISGIQRAKWTEMQKLIATRVSCYIQGSVKYLFATYSYTESLHSLSTHFFQWIDNWEFLIQVYLNNESVTSYPIFPVKNFGFESFISFSFMSLVTSLINKILFFFNHLYNIIIHLNYLL